MNIGQRNQIKSKSAQYYGDEEYMKWQDLVKDQAGVDVTIRCTPSQISIRSADYTDYVLAKAVLSGRTSKEIYRDVLENKRLPTEAEREGQNAPALDSMT